MSTLTELVDIAEETKENSKNALIEKGLELDDSYKLSDVDEKITEIKATDDEEYTTLHISFIIRYSDIHPETAPDAKLKTPDGSLTYSYISYTEKDNPGIDSDENEYIFTFYFKIPFSDINQYAQFLDIYDGDSCVKYGEISNSGMFITYPTTSPLLNADTNERVPYLRIGSNEKKLKIEKFENNTVVVYFETNVNGRIVVYTKGQNIPFDGGNLYNGYNLVLTTEPKLVIRGKQVSSLQYFENARVEL